MNELYNLRIGDMIYHPQAINNRGEREQSSIMAVIYKMTPKYVYYACCARAMQDPGDHFITKDNRVKKESIYRSLRDGACFISYANGTAKRRRIDIK